MWYVLQFLTMLAILFAGIHWQWFDNGLPKGSFGTEGEGAALFFIAMLGAVLVTIVINTAYQALHRIRRALHR